MGKFRITLIYIYMIVDLKVHVEIVHYKGRQDSNMRPGDSFFSEFAKILFLGTKDLGPYFNMRPPPKINVGFAKDSRKYIFYLRRMAVCR